MIVGVSQRTVMLYSDVVQSSVVGSGKLPLLREEQLTRTADWRSTVEPLHHQWIKVRGNQLDILEVEVVNPAGPLLYIQLTHHLFSDWQKAYCEFSKSSLGMPSIWGLYNKHVKYTQGHG